MLNISQYRDTDIDLQFRRHFEYDRGTLVYAPRQSGKTTALLNHFVRTENSFLFLAFRGHLDAVKQYLRVNGYREKVHYVSCMSNPDAVRGKQATTILVDDVCSYNGSLDRFWRLSRVAFPDRVGRYISTSTPRFMDDMELIEAMFPNRLHLDDRVIVTPPEDHFNNEGDLFTI